MSVPATIIYFTAYDQLKVMYGFKPGEKNIYSPVLSGVTARGGILNSCFCLVNALAIAETNVACNKCY